MDRIRKALDLARRDRARVLIDEESDVTTPLAGPTATVLSPVIAPFVAPADDPVIAAPPERTIGSSPANPASAPVIHLASYVSAAARVPPSSHSQSAPSRHVVPASPSAPAPIPVPAAASPTPDPPKAESVANPEPVRPAAATEHAPAPPTTSQAFGGIVAYTRTRCYTPDPKLLESNRIVNPARVDPAAVAFRMLRTQVLQRMDDKGWRSLAILSPSAEDGKTTTAVNLAVSLAYDHRHTVLLVDCDLRRPSVAAMMGIRAEFGLDDVLGGQAEIDQCLYHPEGFDRLVILPARESLANSSEMLSASRARCVVAELHERYPERIVLYDLPPVLGTDDALAFLPMVDCALMVAAERATKREDLLRAMELVTRVPIVGTVLNRSAAVLRAYG